MLVGKSNILRPEVQRLIADATGRETTISGDVHAELLSWTPSLEIDGLTIKNPPWAARSIMFSAEKIQVSVRLSRLLRGQIVIPRLSVSQPVVNLERDKGGRASWEFGNSAGTPNGVSGPARIPAIESLTIVAGSLDVVDQVRKLRFHGSLLAAGEDSNANADALKIRARGTLNEKPFGLKVDGPDLANLTPETPYTFNARVDAADIDLQTQVTVERPFDPRQLQIGVVLTGKDLADVYYLTGLALPNTPPYRFQATVKVSGSSYAVTDLRGRLGSSDLSGQLTVDAGQRIPRLTGRLSSSVLHLADVAPALGVSATAPEQSASGGLAPAPPTPTPLVAGHRPVEQRLLPDSRLQLDRVRGMDADVQYVADSVVVENLPMKQVHLHVVLDHGILALTPLSFVLDQGTFAGSVHIDARQDPAQSSIDMRLTHVDLGQFTSVALHSPPLTGSLLGRVQLTGAGDSLHQFAASSHGAISLVIPHGEINAGIAELTGIDVTRGLGLLLGKPAQQDELRCGVIDFQAQQGVLQAKTLFVDTADVLISGRGDVNLQDEKLDLEIKGDPKHVRLTRLRSPITVGGTLAHPAIGVSAKKLAGQAGVAAALGSLLTPVAAILAFIDPGTAKNKDCAAALDATSEPLAALHDVAAGSH